MSWIQSAGVFLASLRLKEMRDYIINSAGFEKEKSAAEQSLELNLIIKVLEKIGMLVAIYTSL